jgi:hypothetical protein
MLMNLISCNSDFAFVFHLLYLSKRRKRIITNFSRFLSVFQNLSVRLSKIKRPLTIPRLNCTVHKLIAIHGVNKMSTFFCLAFGSIRYTSFPRERFYYKESCTSILKYPDDSSRERTRHRPIDKIQDGPS